MSEKFTSGKLDDDAHRGCAGILFAMAVGIVMWIALIAWVRWLIP